MTACSASCRVTPLTHCLQCCPEPDPPQLAALVAESEKKALLAAAARAVVAEAQKAQREGRLLSRDEIAAIK